MFHVPVTVASARSNTVDASAAKTVTIVVSFQVSEIRNPQSAIRNVTNRP
jgi:hypothetical protein